MRTDTTFDASTEAAGRRAGQSLLKKAHAGLRELTTNMKAHYRRRDIEHSQVQKTTNSEERGRLQETFHVQEARVCRFKETSGLPSQITDGQVYYQRFGAHRCARHG